MKLLSAAEIEVLFSDLESDRVERKRGFATNKDRIRQAICAFANDLPGNRQAGVIIIGQDDDGSCANLSIDDPLLLDVGGLRGDGNILPFPVMRVDRTTIKGCTVAIIVVDPSDQPPVRVDGRTWIRVGPRRALATVEEERRLSEKQLWRNRAFDMRPCNGATLADIDVSRIEREYIAVASSPEIQRENNRSIEDKLRALRLLTPLGAPTNAAVLLFGFEPRQFFPAAYVQFLRIDGTELTDPIRDQKEISGTVPDQIRQIEEVLRLNITTAATIGVGSRVESPDYPFVALQQLIRNALLHRNYDSSGMPVKVYWYRDRIELMNPGGLYGEVTPVSIWKNVTAYRNPGLAEGLKVLGLVERFGYGLPRARQALMENGNPDMIPQFEPGYVLFTLRAAQ